MCSLTADGLAWMPKTPATWNSQVQSILRTEGASGDSFTFFLQLLVIAAQSWINNGAAAKVTCKAICQMLFLYSCPPRKLLIPFGGNTGSGRERERGRWYFKTKKRYSILENPTQQKQIYNDHFLLDSYFLFLATLINQPFVEKKIS
jgi:hypothetical protein